jgi:hypothetical protein
VSTLVRIRQAESSSHVTLRYVERSGGRIGTDNWDACVELKAPDPLALQTHVGQRVAATGLLTGHDLKVSALRVVGLPCNQRGDAR